ncbi:hypothetical protein [Streptomyces zaomyceticus]|uniref:hypothetical protein n=1 Tax=Streptomyces zaomyceticus TaxID=68286 RepID=UPI002E10AD6E|nr:hypothetical protein OG237_06270 [Streptomyces zaomyceticus]
MTPNPIERLDVPAEQVAAEADRLWAERDRRVAALHTRQLEQQIAEIRANARKACPKPDGAHLEDWHAFLDIDPDLRGRDYNGGAR